MNLMIKGMDMPCMCCECLCHDWDMETNRYYCLALKGEPRIVDENTRRDDCPLVEIPTPHGRLIDCESKTFPTAFRYNSTDYAIGWNHCLRSVLLSPTIIEAEG